MLRPTEQLGNFLQHQTRISLSQKTGCIGFSIGSNDGHILIPHIIYEVLRPNYVTKVEDLILGLIDLIFKSLQDIAADIKL